VFARRGSGVAQEASGMIDGIGMAMQAQWLRHEVLANNLANISTAGFKRDEIAFPAAVLPLPMPLPGLSPAPNPVGMVTDPIGWTDFSQGPIRSTGRALDVAISGPGFLVVDTPAGPRYTRNGALEIMRDGTLGLPGLGPVLGERGAIVVKSADVTISPDGQVTDGGNALDRLRVVDLDTPYRLVKEAGGLLATIDPEARPRPAEGHQVVGGALETSNVDAVKTMVAMIELHRLYEACQRVIQAGDETDGEAVNDIGRV
jgi:flagellar basal-body rod protein FlgG